jgi:hypothetical protein
VITKHPAGDPISEPVGKADLSPRAPGATGWTPSRRYIALLRGVAGVNAALVLAAVVAATMASALGSSPRSRWTRTCSRGLRVRFVVALGSELPR